MIYHLVCGTEAAAPLHEAMTSEPSMSGEIIVLQDDLQTGPLQRSDSQSFINLRQEWWQQMAPGKATEAFQDLNRLLELSNTLHQHTTPIVWFWLPPHPTDTCAFTWTLSVLGKNLGRLFVLNLANLPFLDEQNKVFYPERLSQLLPKEWIKAQRLARKITAAELETEQDNWAHLTQVNSLVRTLGSNRKLIAQEANFYDPSLLSLLSEKSQKASRLIQLALSKSRLPVSEEFLAWRLRILAEQGQLFLNGVETRPLKEWELSLKAGMPVPEEAEANESGTSAPN
ncbi:MAG: DUF1835 domain-containing protein [Bacteroidetes bacterium]|nr:DUF1835 domain-containing protein [Bacteroidota bacterium]